MTPYHFFYVYILESMRLPSKLYIGLTNNLRKRLIEHNIGKSTYTKSFTPWKLVYYEAFSDARAARARELSLKNNGNPMRELKKRVFRKSGKGGFTLIETLVAITLLTVAVVTPMSLTTQS